MNKKILLVGFALFLLAAAGWFISVILTAITLGAFRNMANFFGYFAIVSVPATLVLAIIFRR